MVNGQAARRIENKFASSCATCKKSQPVGTTVWWVPGSKVVTCEVCHQAVGQAQQPVQPRWAPTHRSDTPQTLETKPFIQTPSPRTVAPPVLTPWQRYVDYCIASVTADDAVSIDKLLDKSASLHGLRVTQETTLQQGTPIAWNSETSPRKSVRYGWPVVDLLVSGARLRLPLITIRMRAMPDFDVLVAEDDEPGIHPALLLSTVVGEEIAQSLRGIGTSGVDPAELARQTLDVLGLDNTTLEPERLTVLGPWSEGRVHNTAAVHTIEDSPFHSKVKAELLKLRSVTDWHQTAARLLVDPSGRGQDSYADRLFARPTSSAPLTDQLVVEPVALNSSQRRAVDAMCRGANLVVTGPPGTGKTQLVTAAAAHAWLTHQPVLVVSTNNTAVDNAVERANDVAPGLLIRVGNQEVNQNLADDLRRWRSMGDKTAADLTNQLHLPALRAATELQIERRSRIEIELARMDSLQNELPALLHQRNELHRAVWSGDGVPPYATQQRLSARATHAQTARLARRFRLRRFSKNLVASGGRPSTSPADYLTWSASSQRHDDAERAIAEIKASGRSASELVDLDSAVVDAFAKLIAAQVTLEYRTHPNQNLQLEEVRPNSSGFKNAVGATLKTHFGWASTALSVGSAFPLEAGLFDHVVIDEATQCTAAALLPVLYRAKRVTVIGDPNQLNPILNLSRADDMRAARQCGLEVEGAFGLDANRLTHSGFSAWHAIEAGVGPQRTLALSMHYRCHPAIARWFNQCFYKNQLDVVTRQTRSASDAVLAGLHWIDHEGVAERATGGSWINRSEAEAVVAHIQTILESGEDDVGVVTPFSGQARLLRELMTAAGIDGVPAQTAHGFQGGQRNVMIMSAVVSPKMADRTLGWISKNRNLLNVAASRALHSMYVYGHPKVSQLAHCQLLESLRAAAMDGAQSSNWSGSFHSEHEKWLYDYMLSIGLQPLLKPIVEGYELDFLVTRADGSRVNVELDGFHHRPFGERRRRDLVRDAALRSFGFDVLRIPAVLVATDTGAIGRMLKVSPVTDKLAVDTDPYDWLAPAVQVLGRDIRRLGYSSGNVAYNIRDRQHAYVCELELAWPRFRFGLTKEPVPELVTQLGWTIIQASDTDALTRAANHLAAYVANVNVIPER
jgi:very-short-patch-repair endonuclease